MKTMKTVHALLALTAVAAAALTACGGGGAPSAGALNQASAVRVQTYITDNLATDYSKVWVTIKQLSVVDASGNTVTLLDATAAPVVVNLSSLASVGQLMSTVAVPPGIYTEIQVTLGNDVQLVSLDGSTTTNAKFDATGTDFVWTVHNVSLDTSTTGQLVLDFNLAKFTYDATTGLVTPTIDVPKPADAFKKFVREQAEVHGTVQSVDPVAKTLTINDARLGGSVVVSLAADAVIIDETTGQTVALTALAANENVEIRGTVTPGATTADPVTVLASVIHVEPASSNASAHGEGTVTAVSGSLVTVSVDEANFLPGSNSVVVDISSAHFEHGLASDIAVGVTVEFRGTVSGSGSTAELLAQSIDVQGAPSSGEREQNPGLHFSDLNGTVATVNADGTFALTVTQAEGPYAVPGTYTVDPTGAIYKEGNVSCLAAGATVNAVGTLAATGSTFAARYLEISGCSGEKASAPESEASAASEPASSASEPASSASGG